MSQLCSVCGAVDKANRKGDHYARIFKYKR